MKNRILSLACCLALLLGCLAGLGLTASGASTGYTDGTVGQYKGLPRYVDLATEMAGLGDSLIKGMLPASNTTLTSYYSDNNCNNASATKVPSSRLSVLTDGVVGTNDPQDRTVLATSSATMYFDIGYKVDISDFIIATSQHDSASYSTVYDTAIYVGNSTTDLVSEANLVWSNVFAKGTLNTSNGYALRIQPAGGAKVTGRYVAFRIKVPADPVSNWYGQLRMGELAVYGAPASDVTFSVKPVTDEADLPTETALNKGKAAGRWDFLSGVSITGGNPNTATNVNKFYRPNLYASYFAAGTTDVLADGVVMLDKGEYKITTSATNSQGTANIPIAYDEGKYFEVYKATTSALPANAAGVWRGYNSDDAKYLYYDLSSSLPIDRVLLAAARSLPNMTASPDVETTLKGKYYENPGVNHQITTITVYVSDDPKSLFGKLTVTDDGNGGTTIGDDSLTTVAATVGMSTGSVSLVTLDEAVVGRYVGFKLDCVGNGPTFSELAVYGDLGEDVTVQSGNPVFITDSSDADLIPPAEANLLYGKTTHSSSTVTQPATFKKYNLDTGALTSIQMQTADYLTDGLINRINTDVAQNVCVSMATQKYVDLGSLPSLAYASLGAMVVDLGEAKTIDKILIGFANDTNVKFRQWFGKVYVGNDPATVISEDNMIGSWSYVENGALPSAINDHGVIFNLDPVEAQYVALVMPVNALGYTGDAGVSVRMQELGIYEVADNFTNEGGQIRTGATALPKGSGQVALRMANTLNVAGVTVSNHVGDYSNATIKYGAATFDVVEVGTLVGRKSLITAVNKAPEEGLVYDGVDAVGAKIVPAKNVYSQAEDGSAITFTAVITNVPYYMYAEDICARPYVRYETESGEVKTLYGDVMTRNVYDVWAETNDAQREVLDKADYLQAGSGYFAKGSRVVFVGDSITNNGTFIAQTLKYYAAKYPEDKVEMYMAGVKGGTAEGGKTYLAEQVLALNPDYVSIMFGMNDIGREGYTSGYANASAATKANIDTYAANMEAIVKALQAKGVKVILCTPSPYDDTTTGTTTTNYLGCAEALRLCGEKAKALAATYGCDVIDFSTTMTAATAYVQNVDNGGSTNYTLIGSDRVHPGTLGHDLMARIFLNSIGEDVAVPTNEYLLACLKGTASVNTNYQDVGSDFAAKAGAVSTTAIVGSANRKLCSYFEGEFFFVGTENYHTMTLEQKIAKVTALNGKYTGDWRGTECIPHFETNAMTIGSNRYAVQQAAKAVYATE